MSQCHDIFVADRTRNNIDHKKSYVIDLTIIAFLVAIWLVKVLFKWRIGNKHQYLDTIFKNLYLRDLQLNNYGVNISRQVVARFVGMAMISLYIMSKILHHDPNYTLKSLYIVILVICLVTWFTLTFTFKRGRVGEFLVEHYIVSSFSLLTVIIGLYLMLLGDEEKIGHVHNKCSRRTAFLIGSITISVVSFIYSMMVMIFTLNKKEENLDEKEKREAANIRSQLFPFNSSMQNSAMESAYDRVMGFIDVMLPNVAHTYVVVHVVEFVFFVFTCIAFFTWQSINISLDNKHWYAAPFWLLTVIHSYVFLRNLYLLVVSQIGQKEYKVSQFLTYFSNMILFCIPLFVSNILTIGYVCEYDEVTRACHSLKVSHTHSNIFVISLFYLFWLSYMAVGLLVQQNWFESFGAAYVESKTQDEMNP